MKILRSVHIQFIAVLYSGLLLGAVPAAAEDLIVEETLTSPSHFTTIQSAIDFANTQLTSGQTTTLSYRVIVMPGTYAGDITLRSNIPVLGRETMRTIVNGGGSGTLMTASGVSGVAVRNLTFLNAATGISVSNNSTVDITNNVFVLGTAGNAVIVQGSPSSSVINNTFFRNNVAVSRDADGIRIINNIFSGNTKNITSSIISAANINNNFFQPEATDAELRGTQYFPNPDFQDADPLFVDTAVPDFHLQASSPCIDHGTTSISDPYSIPTDTTGSSITSDIGAYGGPSADTIPAPVTDIIYTATTATPYSITISWPTNSNYLVGGYRVYYGPSSKTYTGTDAQDGNNISIPSPVDTQTATTLTLHYLATAVTSTPEAPVLNAPEPRNGALVVSWSAVQSATSYTLYWGITDTSENSLLVKGGNSATISPLTNGQIYKIAVSATVQTTYYIAVTAYDKSSGQTFTPGESHESAQVDEEELAVTVGPEYVSALSNEVTGLPEPLVANPPLPNSGCFIATAAYGSAEAAQVRTLRAFRDGYLLRTAAGRAFVRWYYAVSPRIAAVMSDYPVLKPLVRALLAPLVALAAAANTSLLLFAALILVSGVIALSVVHTIRNLGGPAR